MEIGFTKENKQDENNFFKSMYILIFSKLGNFNQFNRYIP